MDALKLNIEQMQTMFAEKMDKFQEKLTKTVPTTPVTVSSLAADFASFKAFIIAALGNLQRQVGLLSQDVDTMEMRSRRKILLVHGVPERKGEDSAETASKVLADHLKLAGLSKDIFSRTHRMGAGGDGGKSRPILLKFRDIAVRDKVWFAKTSLKGSGITLSEFLTKARHTLFMAARERLGVSKCWTRDGSVYALGSDGKRRRIASVDDLDEVSQRMPASTNGSDSSEADSEKAPTPELPKRRVQAKQKKGKK